MADQAIDLSKYRLRRESRKLVARVMELAAENLAWCLDKRARSFLRENRLHVADLTHVLSTSRVARQGESTNEIFVDGFTVDEVYVRLLIRDNSADPSPSLACLYGQLLTDEEDLVG